MKKVIILFILLVLVSFVAKSQIKLVGNITTNGVASYPTHIDSLGKGGFMVMPTITERNNIPTLRRKFGMLVFVQEVDSLYKLNATNLDNSNWLSLGLASAVESNGKFELKLNIADTSTMLSRRIARDTISLSNRINNLTASTSGTANLKVNIADTSSMLSNYKASMIANDYKVAALIADTATLITRFGYKVNASDTAAMLNTRFARDTVSLSNRINNLTASTSGTANLKVNIADTSSMLSNYKASMIANDYKVAALIADTATLITRFSYKVNASDTAAMLNTRFARDTVSLSNRINQLETSTSGTANLKLNISDTSSMLSNYKASMVANDYKVAALIADTATLITRFGYKVNASDTAAMLNTRFARDTVSLSNRINNLTASTSGTANLKVNIADTSSMLSNYKASMIANDYKVAALIADTATLITRFSYKVNASDTAAMLNTRFARDTVSLSNRINQLETSTSGTANLKLNIADTSSMLSNYKASMIANDYKVAALIADTATLITRFSYKVNASDTAAMLNTRFARDTVSLSNRINQLETSTSGTANLKLNISDTSSMLSNYKASMVANDYKVAALIADTATLITRFGYKVNASDTAAMLSNYKASMIANDYKVAALIADTATLITRFGYKVNASDTAAMLNTRFARDTASLSNRINLLETSTSGTSNLKVNISDTSNMLSNYKASMIANDYKVAALIEDTATLITRFGYKVNVSDTAAMLSNYKASMIANDYKVAALIADTATLITRFSYKVNSSDTAAMLSNRFARDTVSLSNRISRLTTATGEQASYKLNLSDTSEMLSKRFARDTAYLSKRIDNFILLSGETASGKVSYNDTAAMLSNYRASMIDNDYKIASLITDTATLITRFGYKLNTADTAAMLSNYRASMIDNDYKIASLITDTATLITRFGYKLNTADTAAMLSNYKSSMIDNDYKVAALIADTATLITRFGYKVNASDTATMLNTRFARDTASLSNRINQLATSTSGTANLKVNISDTADMLLNYKVSMIDNDYKVAALIADTATLITRFGYKVNASDTAAMLSSRFARDTASLSNRINQLQLSSSGTSNLKVNISDTANMLENYRLSMVDNNNKVTALIADTATLITRFGYKLNSSDTAAMLNTRFARDTASLSNRINLLNSASAIGKVSYGDTADMLLNYKVSMIDNDYKVAALIADTATLITRFGYKVNASDTAAMLNTRFARDTASLSNRINLLNSASAIGKVSYGDTADMLLNYKVSMIDNDYKVAALIADTATLITRFGYKVNASDTAAMLNTRFARDTASLSNRINQLQLSSSGTSNLKVNISDTANMLENYRLSMVDNNNKVAALIADTATLITRFGYKVNASDTAAMLNTRFARDTASLSNRINLLNSASAIGKVSYGDTADMLLNYKVSMIDNDYKVTALIADTATLITRFGYKVNASDTAAMLNTRFARDTASLSNRINLLNSASAIGKVSYGDTADMLLNYKVSMIDNDYKITALIADTATLITRFGYKVNASDTAAMLSSRFARDTASLSNRINILNSTSSVGKLSLGDTATMLTNRIKRDTSFLLQKVDTMTLSNRIDLKLNIRDTVNMYSSRFAAMINVTDTAEMLSKRFARDTASLSSRINLKLNIADTASMFSNRFAKDTVSLSNRIDTKLNASDTALMLSNRFARDTAYLSYRLDNKLNIQDTASFSSRIITSVNNGTTKLNTSDTANMLSSRFYRDTASLSSRIDLKLSIADTVDMLTNRIKRDTSFLIQKADTSAMLSRRFERDTASLSNRINLRLNISDTSQMLTKRFGRDTVSLSDRINLRLNISDTSQMLTRRFGRDTVALSNRINFKLNISDTSAMLTSRIGKDTISLSNRINNLSSTTTTTANLKLNISDTAAMLSNRFARDTVSLSNRIIYQLVRELADEYTATTSQTTFTLTQTPHVYSKVKMYINGVRISNTAYSLGTGVNSKVVTYNSTNNGAFTLVAGDRIQFDYYY